MKEGYDKLYSSTEKTFGGGRPEEIVVKTINLLPADAKAIEFGAGQGRNSIALAEKGFKVVATDISEVGVESINSYAKENGLENLEAKVLDATKAIEGEYDLIVTTFMLHHLDNDEALNFIKEVRSHTKKGGLNAITTFTKDGDFFQLKSSVGKFYPDLGELKEMYSDWDILEYKEESSRARATKEDGSAMFNIKAVLLAKKP